MGAEWSAKGCLELRACSRHACPATPEGAPGSVAASRLGTAPTSSFRVHGPTQGAVPLRPPWAFFCRLPGRPTASARGPAAVVLRALTPHAWFLCDPGRPSPGEDGGADLGESLAGNVPRAPTLIGPPPSWWPGDGSSRLRAPLPPPGVDPDVSPQPDRPRPFSQEGGQATRRVGEALAPVLLALHSSRSCPLSSGPGGGGLSKDLGP